jgi:hypothetical protein
LTVHAKTLQRAVLILGGKQPLRARLRVPMSQLEAWISGGEPAPQHIFLAAVDILSEDAARRGTVAPSALPAFMYARFQHGDLSGIAQAALDAAIEVTHADMGNFQLRVPEGLRLVAHRGFEQEFLDYFHTVTAAHCACGEALSSSARVIVGDVQSHPAFSTEALGVMGRANAHACQSTPVVGAAGELIGVFSTHFNRKHEPESRELALLDVIAQRAAYWLEAN